MVDGRRMHQVLQGSHEQDKVMDLCIHLKHVHSCRSRARPLSTLHPPVPKMHDAHLLVCCVPCGREGELQSSQSVSSVMPSAPARAARLPARTHVAPWRHRQPGQPPSHAAVKLMMRRQLTHCPAGTAAASVARPPLPWPRSCVFATADDRSRLANLKVDTGWSGSTGNAAPRVTRVPWGA